MTAVERAVELMHVPQNKLPPLALAAARRLCSEVGGCMEVFITAFAGYAKVIEGLENTDPAYEPRPSDVAWLEEQRGKT